jgi:pimeloyl-ACP methyl ester carboxylesterase
MKRAADAGNGAAATNREVDMKTIKGYAEGRFGQIHYAVCGQGRPLVLLHQSPTDMVQFARVMSPLAAAGIRAIAVDLPGFGTSDVPDHPPSIAEYAHIVPAVLDALGIAQSSVLGHHTGAIIATEAALQFPERVDKVILHGPLPMSDEERSTWRQLLSREKNWNLRWDGSHLTELWNIRFNAQKSWTDIEAFHANFIHGLLAGRTVWYAHDAVMTYRHEEAMDRLTQPCLILANTGDAIYGYSLRAKERYPQFTYEELPGGTIDCIDELPQQWTDAVVGYLMGRA